MNKKHTRVCKRLLWTIIPCSHRNIWYRHW